MRKTQTPSDHAGADLRVGNPKTCAQFIEILNRASAPLPWSDENGLIYDVDGDVVCDLGPGGDAAITASMIVCAVNTCGSFRAVRETDK